MLVFVWILVFFLAALIGGVAQVLLFKTTGNTIGEALLTKPFLWFIYFFIAHFIGERVARLFSEKSTTTPLKKL